MAEQDHAEQGAATVAETPQITTFEDLACWKKCRELRLFVAKEAIPALPKEERYRLGEQLLRAAAPQRLISPKDMDSFITSITQSFAVTRGDRAGKSWIT